MKKRGIEKYEKEIKEVSMPKIDIYVNINHENCHLYPQHYIKKVYFRKEGIGGHYKVIFSIAGSLSDYRRGIPLFIEDNLELSHEEICKLIMALSDATKLCVEELNLDDLLVE